MAWIKRSARSSNQERVGRRRPRPSPELPAKTVSRVVESIAVDVALSDVLAAHLHDAFARIDVLTNCVDVLAQHCAGALDRVELLESQQRRITERANDLQSTPEGTAPTPVPEVSAHTHPPVTAGRPTLTLVSNAVDQHSPMPLPTPMKSQNRSDRFCDMTAFLHAVVGAQRRSGTR